MERVKNIAQHVTGGGDVRSASFVDELATLAALFTVYAGEAAQEAARQPHLMRPRLTQPRHWA